MNLSISRGELKEAVAGFTKIVNGKSHTLPILGCVRFEHNGHGIVAQATDLDQTVRYTFAGAQAQGEGTFILPLSNIKELAKGNDKETIEFETGDHGSVSITNHVGTHAVKHPIAGTDLDEWPACPAEMETKPAAGFLETYRRLVPFASTDPTRLNLNGVYIDVAETGDHPVTMVATDGRRLSLWNTMNLPVPMSAIVPTTRFLTWKDLQGDAEIGFRTELVKKETVVKGIAVHIGPWSYDVKAIEGQYPSFRQIVPSYVDANAHRITFADADVAVLKKIMPTFPGHESYNETIALEAGTEGRLVVSGRGEGDKETTTLELTGGSRFEGKIRVGVNRSCLLDALHAGFRTFTINDEMSPFSSKDDRGGVHILMPLRLDDAPVKRPDLKTEPESGDVATGTPPEQAPGVDAGAGTNVTAPAPTPASEEQEPKGETETMKEGDGTGTTEQGTALERLQAAYELAKQKVRDANTALVDVAGAIKEAVKEDKQLRTDVESVRAGLAKIQSMKV